MSFDIISNGPPSVLSSGSAPTLGVDTVNFNLYVRNNPVAPSTVAKAVGLAQVANNANILTYNVPLTGLYRVDLYEVSANTPTGATLPAFTVVSTEADTSGTITDTLADVAAVSAANVVNAGNFLVNAKVGTTIVIATTSYAAGSGTALSYNTKVRVTYLG